MGYSDIPQTTAPRERAISEMIKRSFSGVLLGGAWVLHQQVPWSLIGASLDRIIHLPTQSDT